MSSVLADRSHAASIVDRRTQSLPGRHAGTTAASATRPELATVLVIDHDADSRDTVTGVLARAGHVVETASVGALGLRVARDRAFDLAFVDLRLPDLPGPAVLTALRHSRAECAIIATGECINVSMAVDAMKRGAVDVLNKPATVEQILDIVGAVTAGRVESPRSHVASTNRREARPRHDEGQVARPGSIAERWALYVVNACACERDPKTLALWATCAGVSYSSLRELCDLMGIRPHDARDLMRMLRALVQSAGQGCRLEMLLDVGDRRTVNMLFARAGFDTVSSAQPISVEQFLERQHFVPHDNSGLRCLQFLLQTRTQVIA